MRALQRFGAGILTACIALATGVVGADDLPPVPPTPAPILEVVSLRPFTLDRAATHGWRAERPSYTSGYLLVLRVDPSYVVPRQVAEPVLYVGRQTAERVNRGDESGHVVAIVPAVPDRDHPDPDHVDHVDHVDFAKAAIWFGTPELPERVDARTIGRERRAAEAAGIRATAPAQIADARARGGALLAATDKLALLREAAALILEHSPQERALVERLTLE